MKLTQTIHINADAQTVWPFIADPDLHTLWNPGILSVQRQSQGAAKQGDVIDIQFMMSGREKSRKVSVVQAQPPDTIVFENFMIWKQKEQIILETYQLQPTQDGVKLTQTIDISRSRLPWFIQLLFRVFQLLGKDLRPQTLAKLKHVIEHPPEVTDEPA